MLLCHHSGTMRTLPAIVRAIMFAFVIHRACADMSVGSVGILAIKSALKHAAVRAADGLSDTTAGPARAGVNSAAPGESGFTWQQPANMAEDTREYLDALFQGDSEALQKGNSAWQEESKQGFRDPWRYAASTPDLPARTISSTMRSGVLNVMSGSRSDSNDRAGSGKTCQACEGLNTLYEADLPTFESRMEELVVGRGYPLERHTVVTPDGYELVLFRIPHGAQRNSQPGKRPAVLLHHGITLSSDGFVLYGPTESLAFRLADEGFDVWLANQRGNTYSRRNVNGLYPYQPEFWYFLLDTLAQLDLPTQVDYVLQAAGVSKIAYLGHSQGCLLVNLLCASKPEYNSKFSVLALMAPVFFVQHVQQPYLRFGATLHFDEMLYLVRVGEFLPNRLTAPLLSTLCTAWPLDEVCAAAVAYFFFGPSSNIRPQDYREIVRTWPSSVASRNMVHWSQNLRTADDQFYYYDFGNACNSTGIAQEMSFLRGLVPRAFRESCNQHQYGSKQPPSYDLSKVTAPTVHFLAGKDVVSTSPDVQEQQRRIGPAFREQFTYPDYAHMDFIWDRSLKAANDIVATVSKYSAGSF